MATAVRLGIFGGSFNPPHVGHQMVMLYALATARLSRLLMIPCFRHPFEKQLAPFADRLAMCQRAAALFGDRVVVSDLERRLGGESRTLYTVKALAREYPDARLVLIVGSDLACERERWHGWAELATLVELLEVGRQGSLESEQAQTVLLPAVSSSEVRSRLRRGASVAHLVPGEVLDYVATQNLYLREPCP